MAIPIQSSVIERLSALDPDRVRAARLAGEDMRDQLLVLYAFHAELAKIPERVSEPIMGQIRYQWWRDCLDEIYSGRDVRAHEVSEPLSTFVAQTKISRFSLERIITGRERDLDPRPFASLSDAINYADATSGALLKAAMTIGGSDRGHFAGRAWGLTGLARSYRYYADTMLKNIRFDTLIQAARDAYDEAEGVARGEVLPAIAYVALVPGFLKRMERSDYNPLADVPNYAPFNKQVRFLWAVARARI